jgi:hypothetical protein
MRGRATCGTPPADATWCGDARILNNLGLPLANSWTKASRKRRGGYACTAMPARKISRVVPRPFELHWGAGQIAEEATCIGEHHEPALQLLEFEDGSLSIRFCYYDHAGRFQRSPLLVGHDEIGALKSALKTTPRLRRLLRELVT